VLADDMGLGKTVQTLAHLLRDKEAGRLERPALVVAPTSLLSNWRHEVAQFAPDLSVLTWHGPQRGQWQDRIGVSDVVLTTYALLSRDRELLTGHAFHAVILDEAQTIKNPDTKAAATARALEAGHRLALTGTPMENHLGELWSLFHFLLPGLLGDRKQFKRLFRTPVEKHGDPERHDTLLRRVRPFLLRRTKQQVADELPDKTEMVRTVSLGPKQADFYETIRLAMEKRVRDAVADKGLARSQVTVLDALLKLRQACCDPRLVKLEGAKQVQQSAKLELLMEMLPEMVAEGRRILLFSQFTTMLGLIEAELKKAGIAYSKLTGQTKKRDAAIERFRSGQAPVFLISLKAGGTGLNLTEADTVIHFDPWWNPAVEDQATDRAHRIGQDRGVFVYKLVTEGTVEERIVGMQERKAALADAVYRQGGKEGEEAAPQLTESDLEELLKPLE
jgi:SNF2 family DNA or RNA helicase